MRLSAKRGEGGAGVCEGVHADADPRQVVAARHTQQAENQNNKNGVGDGLARNGMQPAEVQHDDDGDENPQEKKEVALRGEIGFAGFVDEFGNVAHGFVDGEIFQAGVNHESESQPEQTEEDAEEQKFVAVHAVEADLRKVGELQIDRKSTRLNSSHGYISYAVFCLT